eukprot:snap_masked-scaffold_3-processed-gene-9.28-mRNA-1 protein AED:1.00 eAED:1.00 QI:0/-1/0/0/-1/1/1/0/92
MGPEKGQLKQYIQNIHNSDTRKVFPILKYKKTNSCEYKGMKYTWSPYLVSECYNPEAKSPSRIATRNLYNLFESIFFRVLASEGQLDKMKYY